ncbi:MAG: MarR family winged helix-turn-helix transcriptional regulator [Acidimicrobiales bacterium]
MAQGSSSNDKRDSGVSAGKSQERNDLPGIAHGVMRDVSTEAVDIFLLIVHLARGLRWYGSQIPEDLRAMVRDAGLAPRHITALIQVAAVGQMSVSQLAERLGVALTTASLLASQLAAQGLVERKEDPEDHRRTLIRIPDRFEELTSGMFKGLLEPIEQVLVSTSAQDREVLKSALQKLADSVTVGEQTDYGRPRVCAETAIVEV